MKLDPLVLTEEQCRQYRLPRTPIKETDRRGPKFEERFGEGATELDALEALHPGELARIVRREIERYIDPDAKRAFHLAEFEHQRYLRRISEETQQHYADDIDALKAEYDDLVAHQHEWHERTSELFGRIAESSV